MNSSSALVSHIKNEVNRRRSIFGQILIKIQVYSPPFLKIRRPLPQKPYMMDLMYVAWGNKAPALYPQDFKSLRYLQRFGYQRDANFEIGTIPGDRTMIFHD